ncbi:hybrid sensor histidine kinase/response regulator [Flavobacteriaceae bacterium LYZ1037]|nr:hybrid sensor histidine kinase/response regulator [Flavobacteriaceae bacterium LYZ1037]
MKRFYIAVIFFYGISSITAQNDNFYFKQITVNEDFSPNNVVSVAQDSTGYLWIASRDELLRYDGSSFKRFYKQFDAITKPNMKTLGKVYIDHENNLWIISKDGILEKFNRISEIFIPIRNIKHASSIYQDSENDTWIGTYGDGLYKISSNKKDTIHIDKNFQDDIYDIIEAEDRHSILFTSGTRIIEMDKKSLNYRVLPITDKNLYKGSFNCLSISKKGTIWAGSYDDGLFYKPKGQHEFKPYKLPKKNINTPTVTIQKLFVDHLDRLWMSTFYNGVFLIDNETVKHFNNKQINTSTTILTSVYEIYQDKSHVIWFGIGDGSLSYYDEKLIKFNKLAGNPTSDSDFLSEIYAIEKHNNSLYFGAANGINIYNFDTESWTHINKENSNLSSNVVTDFCYIDNAIWIALNKGGLNILNKDNTINTFNTTSKTPLNATTIWSIIKDYKNRVWLGTRENGLIQFDRNLGTINQYKNVFKDSDSLFINNGRILIEGNQGDLWIGTEANGIFKYNPDSGETKSFKNDILKNPIRSLYYDKEKNRLWIGSYQGGLSILDINTDTLYSYSMKDGLASNSVSGILPGVENTMWISSERGLAKIDLSIDFKITDFVNYNIQNNLQSLIFNEGACYKDANGFLYFGGMNGVNWFNPSQIRQNTYKPPTVISKVEVFNKEVPFIQNRTFKYSENNLSFTFSALQFSYPEHNMYKYRLKNHDDTWIDTGTRNTISFANLSPGNYTFQVKSANYDGIWSDTPVSYKFTIAQPWYFNTWAKSIYLLLFCLSIYMIYRYFKWRWNMKLTLQNEHAETERLKELSDFKTKVYTNIAHEFRTPLTLISGPIEKRLESVDLSDTDRLEFGMIQRNAHRLLNLINQLLDLSKVKTKYLKLKVAQDNLGLFLKSLGASFEYQAAQQKIDYILTIETFKDAWFDRDVIEKIVTNLLSNAFKYTPKQGCILFKASAVNNHLQILVENNGIQLTEVQLENIFDRFYQINEQSEGVGLGLSLVKELVSLYKGTISVSNTQNNNIVFTVTLPLLKTHFQEEDIVETALSTQIKLESFNDKKTQKTASWNQLELPILLIIEDNQDIRTFVKSAFIDNFQVFEAENGKTGLELAIEIIPDIIISDVMMPLVDGFQLTSQLKQDDRTSHIPIILLTAKAEETAKTIGLETGADDYITKPFKLKLLEIKVRNLMNLREKLQQRYSQELVLKPKDMVVSDFDGKFIKKLKMVLDESLTESSFSVEDFSNALQMSRMQLHRKLKALTGLSATEFIRSQRLKLAVTLLQNSEANISEIGYSVGFNDPSYFTKCFKEAYGCSPSEYTSK